MKLSAIRATQNIEELKPAIKYLATHMHPMAFGDFHAIRNTIASKATEFGVTYREVNELASGYQDAEEKAARRQSRSNFMASQKADAWGRAK